MKNVSVRPAPYALASLVTIAACGGGAGANFGAEPSYTLIVSPQPASSVLGGLTLVQLIRLTKPFRFSCFVLVVLSFFALSFPPFAMTQLPETSTPSFSIPPGPYIAAQNVLIYDSTNGATVYYTLDGTTPTSSSSVYKDAIVVSSTETIQAIAVAPGYSQSALASAAYTINGWLWAYFLGGAIVYPGQTTGNTSTLTLQSLNGFAGTVTLSAVVSGAPAGAHDIPTVSFGNGSSVNLTSAGNATSILTINTIGVPYPSASKSSPALPWTSGGECCLL